MEAWIPQAIDFFASMDGATIYGAGFAVLLLCGLGLPIPEDITLLLMGYMTYQSMPDGAARPHASIVTALAVGLLGVLVGDGFMFFLGRRFGVRLLERWPFSSLGANGRLARARAFLQRNGPKVLFSARFMPGVRSIVFLTSGTLGIRYPVFLFYDGIAALISVPALVLAAWHWGAQFDRVIEKARTAENGVLILILVAVGVVVAKQLWSKRSAASEPPAASGPTP